MDNFKFRNDRRYNRGNNRNDNILNLKRKSTYNKNDFNNSKKIKFRYSYDYTKTALKEVTNHKYQGNIPLRLLDPVINITRFLQEINWHDEIAIELIIKVTIKANDNTMMKTNFRKYLLILIESNMMENQLDRFILKKLNEFKNDNIFLLFFQFITILFTSIPHKAYKSLYYRINVIISEAQSKCDINDEVKEAINKVKVLAKLNEPYNEKEMIFQQIECPPDNFRQISIFPTKEDMLHIEKKDVFLRCNKFKGGYESVDDYLDVQFRLMREDFVHPLREGLVQYLNPSHNKKLDIKIYEKVYIENILPTHRHGIVHRLKFDISRLKHINWNESKRFLHGSLLCLSHDKFETLQFATIIERNKSDLRKGILLVKFEKADIIKNKTYTILETSNLFESYKHILIKLQETKADNFPMSDYIVFTKENIAVPKYIWNKNNKIEEIIDQCGSPSYDHQSGASCWDNNTNNDNNNNNNSNNNNDCKISNSYSPSYCAPPISNSSSNITPCEHFQSKLNESQLDAFNSSLTHELTIIQGPPGTGKTFLGLEICKHLMKNYQKTDKNFGPILVVCYTNHALDQFLEGIMKFTEKIIRIGSRSKSNTLAKYLLNTVKKLNYPSFMANKNYVYGTLNHLESEFLDIQATIQVSQESTINLDLIEPYMSKKQKDYFNFISIDKWLMDEKNINNSRNLKIIIENLMKNEIKYLIQKIVKESVLDSIYNNCNDNEDTDNEVNYINKERNIDDEGDNFKKLNRELNSKLKNMRNNSYINSVMKSKDRCERNNFQQKLQSIQMITSEQANLMNFLSNLTFAERWELYNYWKSNYIESLNGEFEKLEIKYQESNKQLSEIIFDEDRLTMMQQDIIGMTTTGAARYGGVLAQIKCKIIVIEEAAEVLESHVIGSINTGCEHLILIGDHKQLRPNPAVYEFSRKYNLDLSLFERLVNNNLHYTTLNLQHRMRPEIAETMKFIYENLQNHQSVFNYPDIPSVSCNMFFLDHNEPETSNNETISYSNTFEAEFIVKFCERLLKNGIKKESVTILTLYGGQMSLLRRKLNNTNFNEVRVCVLDNYQGEENDIILLSLVRSNKDEKVGFVKTENRICVCLSRAKHGLYVFGNFSILANQSNLWNKIIQNLKERKLIDKMMTLKCPNHLESKLVISKPSDFDKYPGGGCDKICNFNLLCGHICKLRCHVDNKNHTETKCVERCMKSCSKGHPCLLKCHEQCGNCMILETKIIPICNHNQKIQCYKTPLSSECLSKCERIKACGHKCDKLCGQECGDCNEKVYRKCLECGKITKQNCYMIDGSCKRACKTILECGHECSGTCETCNNGRLHQPCIAFISSNFVCGHQFFGRCCQQPNYCFNKCEEGCFHDICNRDCDDDCIICENNCAWNCVHLKCTNLCYQFCNRPMCNFKCRNLISCNHCRKEFCCYGVCGEICRHVCPKCDKDVETKIKISKGNAKFITLLTCGHTFELDVLDKYMFKPYPNEKISVKRCPTCRIIINNRSCFRYSNIVKIISLDIKRVQNFHNNLIINNIFSSNNNGKMESFLEMFTHYKLVNHFHSLIPSETENPEKKDLTRLTIWCHLINDVREKLHETIRSTDETNNEHYKYIKKSIYSLLKWLDPVQRTFNNFEMNDFHSEFNRINMMIRLSEYNSPNISSNIINENMKELKTMKITSKNNTSIEKFTKQLTNNNIVVEEIKFNIVSDDILSKNWYKCKNGHYYNYTHSNENGNKIARKCSKCRRSSVDKGKKIK